MDDERAEFSFLESSLRRSVADLHAFVGSATANHPQGSQLGAYLLAALDAMEQRAADLASRFAQASDPIERGAVCGELHILNVYVRSLHDLTGWLEGLRSPGLSLGSVFFLREASRQFMAEEPDLVLHRGTDYMYSTLGLKAAFEPALATLGASTPPGPAPVVVIYPGLEEDRTLLHALFAHELAHMTVQEQDLVERVKAGHPDPAGFQQRFTATVQNVQAEWARAGDQRSEQEVAAAARGMLDSWIEELLCDHIAAAYLGPTFLFAAAAFLLPTSGAASSTHPPSTMRITSILGFLDQVGWGALLDNRAPGVAGWLRRMSRASIPNTDELVAFVAGAVGEVVSALRQVALDVTHEPFLPDAYVRVGAEVESLLENRIPPVQLASGEPAGRREILMAGWLHCLGPGKFGDSPATLHRALADSELQRFFAAAVEMSYVLETWSAA